MFVFDYFFFRRSLFIHAGLLAFYLFSYSLRWISWAWRRLFLNITQFSWPYHHLRAASHRTPPHRYLKTPKSSLLKSRVVSFLLLLSAPRILNSSISWSLQPRLPLVFLSPVNLFSLVNMRFYRSLPLTGSSTCVRKLPSVHSFWSFIWLPSAISHPPPPRGKTISLLHFWPVWIEYFVAVAAGWCEVWTVLFFTGLCQ